MKKIILLSFILSCFLWSAGQTPFVANNLAVLRVGDGATPLANTGNAVFIDEYSVAGTLVRTLPLPTVASGTNGRLISSGSATSEGLSSLSADGTTLLAAGYDATPPYASSLAGTTAAAVNRSIALIKADGSIDLATRLTDLASGNNPRSAASADGATLYAAGGTGGVRLTTVGATTSTQINTAVPVNIRQLNVMALTAGNTLFLSTGSGTSGIYKFGTALPSGPGNTPALYFATGAGSSPYGFAVSPGERVTYVADDRASAAGGIQKWTSPDGITWTLANTFATGANIGARGLTVMFSATSAVIYATTAESSANRIITITDTFATGATVYTTLATAPTGTAFRGVTFAPTVSLVTLKFISFTGRNSNNKFILRWVMANESSAAPYNVQKSTDGNHFTDIASLPALNNATNAAYDYMYDAREKTAVYFRVRAIELSGRIFYSAIVKNAGENESSFTIYPAVTNETITIKYSNAGGRVSILNSGGVIAMSQDINAAGGEAIINVSKLPAGVYYIKYYAAGLRAQTQRFIKQ